VLGRERGRITECQLDSSGCRLRVGARVSLLLFLIIRSPKNSSKLSRAVLAVYARSVITITPQCDGGHRRIGAPLRI
jgi:hypothetical protein